MKIGIIGSGNVGRALALSLAKNHTVTVGVRDPNKASDYFHGHTNISIGSVREAAEQGDVVFLAVPWSAAKNVAKELANLDGLTLVDCTNPILPGFKKLEHVNEKSGAEQIQELMPKACVIKSCNQTGAENLANPIRLKGHPCMLLAGNSGEKKATVAGLIEEMGFQVVDAGNLDAAFHIEHLAFLWIHLAIKQHLGRDFGFSMIGT